MIATNVTTQPSEPRIGRSVSLEQAASLLGVSRRTIYNRIKDGSLATIRTLGGSQRVLSESVVTLLEAGGGSRLGMGRIPAAPHASKGRESADVSQAWPSAPCVTG